MRIKFKGQKYELSTAGVKAILDPPQTSPINNNNGDSLAGKVVLVTGGSRGIGFSICEAFLRDGAKVIYTGRNRTLLEEAGKLLVGDATPMEWDISNCSICNENLEKAISIYGKIDILINNAGVTTDGSSRSGFFDTSTQHLSFVHDINVKGTYFMCQSVASYMIKNEIKGKIINIASNTGVLPAMDAYTTSKWAVIGMTKGFADYLKPFHISVNGIAPGPIKTDMTWKEGQSVVWLTCANGRLGYPNEIADLAILLAGKSGDVINGQILVCDGGEAL